MKLPEQAPWLDEFLGELLAFPGSRHDDQVDSVSQALTWAGEALAGPLHGQADRAVL